MGVSTDVPKFPVIDRAPSFWMTGAKNLSAPCAPLSLSAPSSVSNFSLLDLASFAGLAAVSAPVGYFAGASRADPRLSALA